MAKCDALILPSQPDTFWAYFAAFIDGEGSITMCQNGPRLIVSNTYLPTLEWIMQGLGCGYLGKVQAAGARKQCYNLNFGSNAIRAILPKIIPYLHEKRHRAEVLLRYLETVVPRGGTYHVDYQVLRQQVKQEMRTA